MGASPKEADECSGETAWNGEGFIFIHGRVPYFEDKGNAEGDDKWSENGDEKTDDEFFGLIIVEISNHSCQN